MKGGYYLPIYACFIILLANGTVVAESEESKAKALSDKGIGNNYFFINSDKFECQEAENSLPEGTEQPDRWLAWDKFWHFSASFVTVGAGYHLCANRIGLKRPLATGIAIGGTLGIGTGKELIDRYGWHRRFSWKDLVANMLGIGLGYFVFIY